MKPADMVANYLKLREHKKAAEAEFKKEMARPAEAMEKLESMMLEYLNESGADSIACGAGTVYRTTKYSATVTDKEAFRSWIVETGNEEASDLRANKAVIRQLLEENEGDIPGVKYTQMASIGVRSK